MQTYLNTDRTHPQLNSNFNDMKSRVSSFRLNTTNCMKIEKVVLRITTVVLVPTRSLNWHVGSVANLVTLKRIAVVKTQRMAQALVIREMDLRNIPKTNVRFSTWLEQIY